MKIAAAAIVAVVVAQWALRTAPEDAGPPDDIAAPAAPTQRVLPDTPSDPVVAAFERKARDLQMDVEGRVDRVLSDDRDGSRHQRFILRTFSGHTVLVAHNIDLAPRLEGLTEGESISLRGEYEWNPEGGVIHWTHRDPGGSHPAGYIEWKGRRYQ